MRAAAALLALAALLLAGCAAEPPQLQGRLPGAPDAGPVAGGNATDGGGFAVPQNTSVDLLQLPAPVWVVGDSWSWSIDAGQGGGPQQFVVYGDGGADYLLASTDPEDAVTTVFLGRSLPGRVSKQFLSGYDNGVATRFLDFPLQTNKTWNLHVRGTDFPVRANFTPTTEGGRGPGFNIEGKAAAGLGVKLQYSAAAKWMTRFQVTDAQGGNIFTRTLVNHRANYTGPYFTARVEDLYLAQKNGTVPAPPVDTFTQGRAYTQLRMSFAVSGAGSADVRVLDPTGQPRFNYTATSGGGAPQFQQADLPNAPGAWRVTYALAGPIQVDVRVAGVDLTEGSL